MIEAIEKQLALSEEHVWPSKYTLWRYGNTSSSSIWYNVPGQTEYASVCGSTCIMTSPAYCSDPLLHMSMNCSERQCVVCRYVLAFIETQKGIRKGDRVWQLAFGSGFKVNSAVWHARRSFHKQHAAFQPSENGSQLDEIQTVDM